MRLLPIVEGPGDIEAVPILIRSVLHFHGLYDVDVLRPYRFGDVHKVARNYERYVRTAEKEKAAILWAIDCDDGCPVQWVKHFEQELPGGITVPVRFAFFCREYECIFLAERECLRHLAIPEKAELPTDPESVRGAKEFISSLMPRGSAYKETVHQARLTARLDLGVARKNSRTFRHLEKTLLDLVGLKL